MAVTKSKDSSKAGRGESRVISNAARTSGGQAEHPSITDRDKPHVNLGEMAVVTDGKNAGTQGYYNLAISLDEDNLPKVVNFVERNTPGNQFEVDYDDIERLGGYAGQTPKEFKPRD